MSYEDYDNRMDGISKEYADLFVYIKLFAALFMVVLAIIFGSGVLDSPFIQWIHEHWLKFL